jgi:hypothetical protein
MRPVASLLLGAFLIRVGLSLASPTPASGADVTTFDHLKCYKLAYSKKKGVVWTPNDHAMNALTLTPLIPVFGTESGCQLLPKKNPHPTEICTPVDKQPRQGNAGPMLTDNYLCYKVSCPAGDDSTLFIGDQFGSGQAIVKHKSKTRRLCVPEAQS